MSFKDIKGQELPIYFLRNAMANNTVAHAYLFVGMDGVGKSFVARTLAKALNCEREEFDACDVCASCRKIETRNHPDIFWIVPEGAKGVIKIGSIRALQERISLKPYEAKWKVYIIEDAHLMTEEAKNSLLKTLEEPPPHSILILTTSNISGLFQTIVSRCQVVKFSPLPSEIIENILVKKFGFLRKSAKFISHLSGGGMNKKAIEMSEDYIIWKNKIIDEFMKGSFFEEDAFLFSSFKEDSRQALLVLINWYRDMLICKNGVDKTSIINLDRVEDLDYFSNKFSYEDIDRRLDALMDAYLAAGQNVNPKLIIGALV